MFGRLRVLALALLAGTVPAAAQTVAGRHLRAEFGARGLTAITDLRAGVTHRVRSDDAAVSVAGQRLDTSTLPTPTRERTDHGVVYTWRAGVWTLQVTYELKPDWTFVSKRVGVLALAARSFHVDSVVLLRTRFAQTPTDIVRPMSAKPSLGTREYGAALRFGATRSVLAVAQNPFLDAQVRGSELTLKYAPDMDWRSGDGAFESDRALLSPVALSGTRVPAEMTPEWQPLSRGTPGLDEAEVSAFTAMVRAMMLYEPATPLNVFVGWCANDYQIDVGTREGREEYTRLFDQASAVGAQYVLYAPSNSAVSRREQSVDDWSWEHVLWLGLGQQIRRNEWNPRTSAVPPSIQEMLNSAAARRLKLLAYVYPVLPFSQNAEWLVPSRNDPKRQAANLGNRALQDWLIEELIAFHKRTGIAGFSFDHTFLTYDGASRYAQWYGWRRVMEELRRRVPDIVIDGRQAHHLYGPWSYLAGSYPHPTFHDEQPESFTPYPDLHFDRVSANRERYTAYRFRYYEFTPNELVPGFMTHQTPRLDERDDMPFVKTADRGTVILPFRARDWDYLGWKYSVLSSIAVGGWNNVINMLPARDSAERANFRAEDQAWLRGWLQWTADNKELLRKTRHILGQPALGKIDGTAMMDGDHGYIFLFNPDPRALRASVALDASLGLTSGARYMVREVFPFEGRRLAGPQTPYFARGDSLAVTMAGGSALVLEVRAAPSAVAAPVLFGAAGTVTLDGDVLSFSDVRAEQGSSTPLRAVVPAGSVVRSVRVNGQPAAVFTRTGDVVSVGVQYGASRVMPFQPVVTWDSTFTGGRVTGTITIPPVVTAQLAARRSAWPIPWTADDYRTTWLAPERLMLWAPFASADDTWEARLTIDDRPVELRKAYTAIQVERSTFTGFFADLSLLDAGRPYRFTLDLPRTKPGQFLGLYLENIEPVYAPAVPVTR